MPQSNNIALKVFSQAFNGKDIETVFNQLVSSISKETKKTEKEVIDQINNNLSYIFNKNDRKIIGGFLVGDGASEIIITIENMIREKKTIDDVRQMIFPHPSIGEVIQECV